MNERAKRGRWLVVAIIALPFVSCGAFGVFGIFKVRWARATVREVCDRALIGGPIAGIEENARDRHLDVMTIAPNTPGAPHKEGKILVWSGFVFARHFCEIDHDGTTVLAKHTSQ